MIQDEKFWQIAPAITSVADQNLEKYPQIIRQILFNRGISTAEEAASFFNAELPSELTHKEILGLDTAISRIAIAIHQQEPIAVYGDYDVDGVTATALLTLVLEAMGANVRPYIPNRFDEGYGLNLDAIQSLKADGIKLIITVDCGIRSPDEAIYAKDLGIDLIISDHHHPSTELPDALVIINPKQEDDPYPYKDLAGVGLAYKIAEALIPYMEANHIQLDSYLDLVALGTVADLAPLTGENRYLVRKGLQTLRKQRHQGLLSLMQIAGVKPEKITAGDIGFSIGPRLNASGRLDSALASLKLLITKDIREAGPLAQQLDDKNKERQRITKDIQATAESLAFEEEGIPLLLFASHPDFNPGVVGLAASRLSEMYYRPAIVASQGEKETRGSCRSIKEFHITEALDQCKDLLIRHGGHAAAAGFTVENKKLSELKSRLSEIAQEQLKGIELQPTLLADIDIPLHSLRPDLMPEIMHYLALLEPTGYGNRQPHFVSRDLFVNFDRTRAVGNEGSHLKLSVTDGLITFDAIAFRQGYWHERLPRKIDILYTIENNEFNGRSTLQLNVKDIKPSK